MNLAEARAQFPALEEKTFLDAACVSLAPRLAVEAITQFLEHTLTCPSASSTLHHIAMDELREEARVEVARFLGAEVEEIALVESTSHGLSLAAAALPLERGDRVLISDLEFMEVAIPWLQLQARGVETDCVPNRRGRAEIEDFAARLTPAHKGIAISSVQWSNGYRCDLEKLSSLCRERGVWLVVDAIQQLGAVPLDVRKTPIDVLACGGHKWLNSPFGTGILYLRRERWPELRPPLAGYMSVKTPTGGWGHYFQTPSIAPVAKYEFVAGARRFETGGTSNYAGAIGLAASLKMMQAIGPQRIAKHIGELTERLIAGLDRLGLEVVTPRERERRAGIVTFTLGSAERDVTLMERLLERKILVAVRYTSRVGGVRVSCHFYNNEADIERLLDALVALGRGAAA
jgi:selenocysteine lyase/cysteine desulfurase